MTGLVKLADFGASKSVSEAPLHRMQLLKEPYWTAPEVISSATFDTKIDIWSVGITAIELARWEPPYRRLHPTQALFQLQSGAPPTLDNSFSLSFIDFVNLCLLKSAELRPDAESLLNHRFIRNAKRCHVLTDLLEFSNTSTQQPGSTQHARSASMNAHFNGNGPRMPMHRHTLSTGSHYLAPSTHSRARGSTGFSPPNSGTSSMRASIVIQADQSSSAPQSPTRHVRFGSGEFFVVEESSKPRRRTWSENTFVNCESYLVFDTAIHRIDHKPDTQRLLEELMRTLTQLEIQDEGITQRLFDEVLRLHLHCSNYV
jgi:serine/threonine protein kinase